MPSFHKPNLDELLRQAEQAEEEKKNRGFNDGDIRFFNGKDGLATGNNMFVVCPPYSEAGLYVFKEFSHWTAERERSVCPELTHPGTHLCPVCAVLRDLAANNHDAEQLREYQARPTCFVNVLPLEIGNKRIDYEDPSNLWLPHILRCSPMVGDFIIRAPRELPDFAEPGNAARLTVKKTVKGGSNKRSNTRYEISWYPDRINIGDEATLEAIASSIYPLDKIFGRWNEERWKESVARANSILARFHYEEYSVAQFAAGIAPPPEEQAKEAPKAASPRPAPAASGPRPAGPTVASGPRPAPTGPRPAMSTAGPRPAAAAAASLRPAPAPAAAPATAAPRLRTQAPGASESIVRTAQTDPTGERPACFAHQSAMDPECTRCAALETCVVESLNRMTTSGQ